MKHSETLFGLFPGVQQIIGHDLDEHVICVIIYQKKIN